MQQDTQIMSLDANKRITFEFKKLYKAKSIDHALTSSKITKYSTNMFTVTGV